MAAQFFTNIDCLKASVRALGTWVEHPAKGDRVMVMNPEIHLTVIDRKWVDGVAHIELGAPANYVHGTIPAIEELVRRSLA